MRVLKKLQIGVAQLSMIVLFIILSVYALISAFNQARPEWSMPLSNLIIINETMALAITLVYGIVLHFVMIIATKVRKRIKSEQTNR